jgi:hypothetical protein
VFFLGEILPLGDEYKRAVNPTRDLKQYFCKNSLCFERKLSKVVSFRHYIHGCRQYKAGF